MRISRLLLAAFFVTAGSCHFIAPQPYLAIIPPILPWPAALVYLSGAAEIIGGTGILPRSTRRVAAGGLIALLLAVFPANIYAAMHGMQLGGHTVPQWILWARLPIQPLLILWVYFASWKDRKGSQ